MSCGLGSSAWIATTSGLLGIVGAVIAANPWLYEHLA